MAILVAGIDLLAQIACKPWKCEKVKKEFTKPQAKSLRFFYLKNKKKFKLK
jgi:hypothetical protein